MNPMRLLVVAMPESVHTARWLGQLAETGWKIDLFSSHPSGTTHPGLRGVTTHHFFHARQPGVTQRGLPLLQRDLAYLAERALDRLRPDLRRDALVSLIRRLRPDVVHSLEFQSGAYLTLRAKELIGDAFPPWLATNWGSDIAHFSRFPEHAEKIRRVLASADAYSCECARDARLAARLGFRGLCFPPSPNAGGYDLDALAPLRATPTSRRRVVMVKGYQHFVGRALVALRAVEACADALAGYRVCVYSATRDVAAEAREVGRRTGLSVEVLPAEAGVPHREILALHGRARLSIGLSMSDGVSTSFLEAFLMGSFPIQSWTSCANEWISDGETGILVPPEDAEATADAIRKAVASDALVDSAAARNWAVAGERLDARALARRAVAMYEEVLRSSRRAPRRHPPPDLVPHRDAMPDAPVSTIAPLVSIVIPVYNGANYLREAIDSALAQTYPQVEVLVVNDGSTDGGATAAIARSYGDRIRYLEKKNGGVASALNLGLREMRGEYFSWLSHDDLYLPRKIEAQVSLLRDVPSPRILYGDYEQIDASGRHLSVRHVGTAGLPFRFALVATDPVNGCTVLVPRACFDAVGGFDERLRTAQDYDLWFRLAKRFPFVHVREALVKSRIHPAQGTQTIPTFLDEANRQMIRFLEEMGVEEARAAGLGAPSVPFTRVALATKLRGLDVVATAALDLSRRHSAEDTVMARIQRATATLACRLLTRKMKPGYWWRRLRERLR